MKIGWQEKDFPAEKDGKLFECEICSFTCRWRDTKIEYGYRVCPDCQDKERRYSKAKEVEDE